MPSKPAAPFYMSTSGTWSFKFLYILVIFVIVFWIIAIQWVWSGILLWLWFSFPCWLIMVNTFSCAYCLLVYLFFFENHLYPLLIFLKLWEYLNVYWSFKFPLLWISVTCIVLCCSLTLQFSRSVVSDSLRPHESQHTRPSCPSPTPGVYSNPCPLSRWCHPAISSSVVPFSSCSQSLPASGSFPVSQLFAWSDQTTGVSASASVLPINTQDWSPLGRTGWISSQSKGLSRVFSNTTVQKHQFIGAQLSSQSNSHIHTWPLGKP